MLCSFAYVVLYWFSLELSILCHFLCSLLCIRRCPRCYKYIQSLNRVCSVQSYIESRLRSPTTFMPCVSSRNFHVTCVKSKCNTHAYTHAALSSRDRASPEHGELFTSAFSLLAYCVGANYAIKKSA
jgi:hypothetical protein